MTRRARLEIPSRSNSNANARIKCPSRYKSDQTSCAVLIQTLGPRELASLQHAFGGQRIWIPKIGENIVCGSCARRNGCIKSWRRQKRSVAAIADYLALSKKSIYRILKNPARRAIT
ncbi:MAG: hypothetical protein ACYCPQ_00060 [Elusimicrobiota bacterium]